MTARTEENRFASTCFVSVVLCLFASIAAFLIYFLIPSTKKIVETPVTLIAEEVVEQEEELEDFVPSFQEYLAEVSYEKLNDNTDAGLVLYRQSVSRPSVEWFYTHITGNKEVAQAILSEADKNEIPLSLAFSLAYTESRYNVKAVNKNSNTTTDRGLFQLNNASFPELTEEDFFDPFISSKYGMAHLKFCLTSAGNPVSGLAMYNAGTNRVRSNKTPQTTLNYVGKILSYQNMLDDLFNQEVASYYETQLVPGITVAYVPNKR
ncbi:MAG: lytic transglycosylase domain-containing protein [Treponema sp.]|nr:lytic transglycosylase domain-containing protein [Treponema sp.]